VYLGNNVVETLAQLARIHLRQQALKSLVARRHKRIQESLDHRITRAKKEGKGNDLTRGEWVSLHKQELAHVRGQLADLQLEIAHAREQGTALRRIVARAKRLRGTQPPVARKQT
jgi:hypothetical protein